MKNKYINWLKDDLQPIKHNSQTNIGDKTDLDQFGTAEKDMGLEGM